MLVAVGSAKKFTVNRRLVRYGFVFCSVQMVQIIAVKPYAIWFYRGSDEHLYGKNTRLHKNIIFCLIPVDKSYIFNLI